MLNLNALLMTANAVAYLGVLAMVGPVAVQRLRSVSRLALVGVLGGLAAACSSETLRMSGDPFASPFKSSASAEPSVMTLSATVRPSRSSRARYTAAKPPRPITSSIR